MKALVQAMRGRTAQPGSGLVKSLPGDFQQGWAPIGGYAFGGGSNLSPARMARGLNAYGGTDEASAAIFSCTTLIADTLAGYPRQIVDQDGNVIERTAFNDDLFELLEEPSQELTYFDWVADVQTDMELVGNSYWLCDNQNAFTQPESLERLAPGDVEVVTDKQDRKIGYTVTVKGIKIPFGLEDVIHYRTRNPLRKHYGMGVVEAIARELNQELAQQAHVTSFFTNGARLAGVLTVPEAIDEVSFNRLKEEIQREYGGAWNAYKMLIATGATDFKPVSAPPAALGIIDLRRMSLDTIYKAFGIPEFLLGGVAQGGVYKMGEAQFIFFRRMLPRATRFQERTTLGLTARWEGHRFQVLPEQNEPPEQKREHAAGIRENGGSLNETRTAMDLPLIEDPRADVPMLPAGLVPFGTVVTEDGQVRSLTDEPVRVPRLAPGAKGALRVPWAQQPPGLPAHLKRLPKAALRTIVPPALPAGYEQWPEELTPKASDPEVVQAILEGQARFFVHATPHFRTVFVDYFNEQRSRVVNRLQAEARSWQGLPRAQRVAARKALDPMDLWNFEEENAALLSAYLSSVDELGADAIQVPAEITGATVRWEPGEYPAVGRAREALGELIVRINDTTRTRIAEQVEEGARRGYDIPRIANGFPDEDYRGIMGVFDQATAARAETIARSETAMLFNRASGATYRTAGIELVEIFDGTGDPGCREANGSVWPLARFEENPIEHPNCVRAGAPRI